MNKKSYLFLPFILFNILLCAFANKVNAQNLYGNEWINYNQTYFKIKVAVDGLYRIPYATLSSYGLNNINGSEFVLYREGQEQPIYVTTFGTFGTNDFIEFYGKRADGKLDQSLYESPNDQPNEYLNSISDTAYYFLTYNNSSNHLRYTDNANTITTPLPTAITNVYVYSRPSTNERTSFIQGESYYTSTSSSETYFGANYGKGEGYGYSAGVTSVTYTVTAPQLFTTGSLPVNVEYSVMSRSKTSGTLKVDIGNVNRKDTMIGVYGLVKDTLQLLNSNITTSNAIKFTTSSSASVMKLWLLYPRSMNFTGLTAKEFELRNYAAGNYLLALTNTSNPSNQHILYDLENKERLVANTQVTTAKRFIISSNGTRKKFYYANVVNNIDNLIPVNFKNYTQGTEQGNYIILSNSELINGTPNAIGEYKAYRNSTNGGNHQSIVVDVNDLYNEFNYGYEFHPSGVKNFLKFAYENWNVKPEHLFIIGKGLNYNSYISYSNNRSSYNFVPVPTYGVPGSDNLLSDFNNTNSTAIIPTGRLNARNNTEIANYLQKVKDYENALKIPMIPNLENSLWKKTGLHIAGGTNTSLQSSLIYALNQCKDIISDTLTGMNITTVAKGSTSTIDNVSTATIDSLLTSGLQIINFYGHSSTAGFEFNLNFPDQYTLGPKYPIFNAFGCNVAEIFNLSNTYTISEQYVKAPGGGSIAMIASNNISWTSHLPLYMTNLYKNYSYLKYGKTLGEQYKNNIDYLYQLSPTNRFTQVHNQTLLLQGDPALRLYSPEKVDYYTDNNLTKTTPAVIDISADSFTTSTVIYNLGKYTKDTVNIVLTHTKSGNSNILFTDTIKKVLNEIDTIKFRVPINDSTDIGLNNYLITVNPSNAIDEISYQNNSSLVQLYIAGSNIKPLYPKDYSIVYSNDWSLKASTLNAFATKNKYRFEIDTTQLFNSGLKQSTSIESTGGVISWKPTLSLQDSVVYYWRCAIDTLIDNDYRWQNSSFIYLKDGNEGWNQSHFFQYSPNNFSSLSLPETRKFAFAPKENILEIKNNTFTSDIVNDIYTQLNDLRMNSGGCTPGVFQFHVINSNNGLFEKNNGQYPGISGNCVSSRIYNFERAFNNTSQRNSIKNFINTIPAGSYLIIKTFIRNNNTSLSYIDSWFTDTSTYGIGNTLYDKFKELGFDKIDSFTSMRSFIFMCKIGDPTFPVYQVMSEGPNETITLNVTYNSFADSGSLKSIEVGPAKEWKQLLWKYSAVDTSIVNDSNFVNVYGIDENGTSSYLFSTTNNDTSLATINATTYPKLKLEWSVKDTTDYTASNLDYWRVLYTPYPEAAFNPNKLFSLTDTVEAGDSVRLRLALENVSKQNMDSMLVKFKLIDAQNNTHDLGQKRYKALNAFDTLTIDYKFDPRPYIGKSVLYIEANPDNDQLEEYHPNNLGYVNYFVKSDTTKPILDVTFDGIHILDRDIVSAKPFIKVMLKDNNKTLALSDTSLLKLSLVYPNNSTKAIPFDGTICRFIPADLSNNKNEAYIEFNPTLEDGIYQLMVSGKDNNNNQATNDYQIAFEVINRSTITNVLNYPNPFSTSTKFVFTLTGSEIPSQFKIQILTVTGKVVKEITKEELGPIRIGRNMTEYAWDGKDQYGQMLGNGVYLYRVITNIQGEKVEQRNNTTIDKYFKNGYGKMYIMR